MARRRAKRRGEAGDVGAAQEEARAGQTQNFNTQDMNTLVMERNQIIDTPTVEKPGEGLGELASAIRELVAKFGASAAPGQFGQGAGGGGGGGASGGMGGGSSGPPPASDASPTSGGGSAAKRFLAGQGSSGAGGLGSAGTLVAKALGKFAGEVGDSIGRSGLEVSGAQAAREHGIDPGRFTESALGLAAESNIPGVSGLARLGQGIAHKANADSDARSGRTALIQARTRLADIAGGLAQRGAHFTNSELLQARDVLQQRAQNELDVRLQIRNLEESVGAQRSGLGAGGHAR